jgi:hypothetical protein
VTGASNPAVIKAQHALSILHAPNNPRSAVPHPYPRSIALGLVLSAVTANVVAAPFTPDEVARRMQAGAELSAFCFVEAKVNRAVDGENCRNFLSWIDHDFPLIKQDLAHADAATAANFEAYKQNLAAIVSIGQAAQPPFNAPPKL